MANYTLRVRRQKPQEDSDSTALAEPYWQDFQVDLDPTLSVLDGLLQASDREDGSLAVRCSCRAAICGSCGVKINGESTLACKTQLGDAQAQANRGTEGVHAATVSGQGPTRFSSSRWATCR